MIKVFATRAALAAFGDPEAVEKFANEVVEAESATPGLAMSYVMARAARDRSPEGEADPTGQEITMDLSMWHAGVPVAACPGDNPRAQEPNPVIVFVDGDDSEDAFDAHCLRCRAAGKEHTISAI